MRNIKYLIMDVDGTMTDGKIYMGTSGELCKAFNVKDGYAIGVMMPEAGIEPVIITGRKSDIVVNRARELKIEYIYQDVVDKVNALLLVTQNLNEVAVIGDDLNDISMMKTVKEAGGIIGCPADAADDIKGIADFIAPNKGGEGAVRSFVEWLLCNTSQ